MFKYLIIYMIVPMYIVHCTALSSRF